MEPFSPVLQRFIAKRPISVMARATMERLFDADAINTLFEATAERQYTRELSFAHVVGLMNDVVFGVAPSVHASYQQRAEEIAVSSAALYQKLNGIEPRVCSALVRYSHEELASVLRASDAGTGEWLSGYRVKIVDGNHLSATEHRLKELRQEWDAALPGKAVVILDAATMSISDVYVNEDGHSQECEQIPALLDRVEASELWLADRHYSTLGMMMGVAERGACFLIRQHGAFKPQPLSERVFVGKTETGKVYQQEVRIGKHDRQLQVRRITVELDTPTRNAEREIHLLTNVPEEDAKADHLSLLYLKRWTIEQAFFDLTTCLQCEIKTLGYPKAALFTFTLALVAYNIVSLIKAIIRRVHGPEAVDEQISPYYLALEIRQSYDGMTIVVDEHEWRGFQQLSPQAFAQILKTIAAKVNIARYRKHKRGPKKKPPKKKPYVNGSHLSTAKLIASRDAP